MQRVKELEGMISLNLKVIVEDFKREYHNIDEGTVQILASILKDEENEFDSLTF